MKWKKSIFFLIALFSNVYLNAYTLDLRVNTGNNDAEERLNDNSMYLDSSDLELVYDGSRRQKVGMIFENVQIPSDANITNAYIQFTVDETDSGTTNLVVEGEKNSNPSSYSGTTGDITNRTETDNNVSWNNVPAWNTVGEAGVDQRTPDLSDIIQELIGQSGWQSGNAMAIMIAPGTNCNSSGCQRTAEAYDGESAKAPLLHIEFTAPAPAPTAPIANYWFDECKWDGTSGEIKDHSGNDWHGQSHSAASPSTMTTGSNGVIQRMGDFTTDNTTDFVELPADSIDGLNNFTVAFWYKTSSAATGSVQTFFDSQQSDQDQHEDNDMTELRVSNNNEIVVNLGDQSYYYVDAPSGVNLIDNAWHQVVWTRTTSSGNNNCIYIDGSLAECLNRTEVGALRVSYFELGQEMDGIGDHDVNQNFEGVMDEFKVYNTNLSAVQISDLYDNEAAGLNWDGSTRAAGSCGAQAIDDRVTTFKDTDASGNVLLNDTGGGLSVTSHTSPSNGSVTIDANGDYTYTPDSGYTGDDSFTYTITADDGTTSTATVYITVFDMDGTLIAEYRLDECAYDGDNDVRDNSINNLHGETVNGVNKTDAKVCKGASFDGSDDYIEIPNDAKFNITGSMTVSFWVYPERDTTDEYYVSKYDGSDGWRIWFDNRSSDRIEFYLRVGSHHRHVRIYKPSNWTNNWHLITAVYDNHNGTSLYVKDAVGNNLSGSDSHTGAIRPSSEPLFFAERSDNKKYFKGKLDEVKIWGRALSSQEISDMYDNESAGRNWNEDTATRVCNTCSCSARVGASMVSFQSDFRNMTSGKDLATMLSPDFGNNYGSSGDWYVVRRDYDIVTDNKNDAYYTPLALGDELEFGKGYWIKNATSSAISYACNLKTMDFNATIEAYPSCQSVNGKCVLVDLVEPNGTNNNGPYIYTLTSFPVSKEIRWEKVRVLINGASYPVDSAPEGTLNSTVWRYDGDGSNYTTVTPNTPGQDQTIEPCSAYWVELDKNATGKDVKLLIPQE